MSLTHTLLGFLNYHPYTGYDLKSIFDRSVQHFWYADQSQIYRALAQIADSGWAEIQVIRQDDRPDHKVYHLTEAGRAELDRWLIGPVPVERSRSAPMIMVFFAGMLSNQEALPIFRQAVAYMQGALEQYDQAPVVIDDFGAMFVVSLFFGRLWCGWACPAGGLQEFLTPVNNRPVLSHWPDRVKWLIWAPWVLVIAAMFVSAGGIRGVDFFHLTTHGISVGEPGAYIVFYVVIGLFVILSLTVGSRLNPSDRSSPTALAFP